MCRGLVIEFFFENTTVEEFRGKKVLEIGSRYVNGSVRPFVERFLMPASYVGIDIEQGRYVDLVVPVGQLVSRFGPDSFDVIISTETLEHLQDWKDAITNIKAALKTGGLLYLTTVRKGYGYHGYPYDFWRYEGDDMREIFRDFEIASLQEDAEGGICLKAVKPEDWRPCDLGGISLYSILLGRRTAAVTSLKDAPLGRRFKFRLAATVSSAGMKVLKKAIG